jgi:1,4-dihydroxy-2-naphthoate octaprenyltransferase
MRTIALHPGIVKHENGHSLARGLWRLADPKIALASLVPFCVGAALAWNAGGRVAPVIASAAFLAVFFVEVGKNAVNDLYDFRSGADLAVRPDERSPFSGGKRVLVDRLLTGHDLVAIAWIAFALAGVTGVAVAMATKPMLIAIGAAAAAVSVAYAMPPLQLAYRGLGELAVFLVYGPGILLGSFVMAGGVIDGSSVVASITLGILIAVVLLANELPDERADRLAGKRTLVVRLGRERAVSLIGLLMATAFAIPTIVVASGGPGWFAGALTACPVALFAWWSFSFEPAGPPVVAQTATLVTYVVTGIGLATAALVP